MKHFILVGIFFALFGMMTVELFEGLSTVQPNVLKILETK